MRQFDDGFDNLKYSGDPDPSSLPPRSLSFLVFLPLVNVAFSFRYFKETRDLSKGYAAEKAQIGRRTSFGALFVADYLDRS